MCPKAFDGAGREILPGSTIFPIAHEISAKRLKIVGTGFYITRYGLFLTARHVIEDFADYGSQSLATAYVLHRADEGKVFLRRILTAAVAHPYDIAIAQADNYSESHPNSPLANRRVNLTLDLPAAQSELKTYAYPENAIINFNNPDPPVVRSDYYQGALLRYVEQSEHPYIRYPHFETTIELRGGASGGPVFDTSGRVIGVNSRGWDFGGAEGAGDPLSYVVPVTLALGVRLSSANIPTSSWEYEQVPQSHRGRPLSLWDLIRFRHVQAERRQERSSSDG